MGRILTGKEEKGWHLGKEVDPETQRRKIASPVGENETIGGAGMQL